MTLQTATPALFRHLVTSAPVHNTRLEGEHYPPPFEAQEALSQRSSRRTSAVPRIDIFIVEQQIERLIRVEKARRRFMPTTQPSAIEWMVLLDLARAHIANETVYAGVLRASLDIPESELWSSLERLEKDGLVSGTLQPSSDYRVEVGLTKLGLERIMLVLAAA